MDKTERYRQGVRKRVYDAVMLGLGAKLAAADGQVNNEEILSFSPFLLAMQNGSDAGILAEAVNDNQSLEHYAKRIVMFFPENTRLLQEIVQSLFDLAVVDGPLQASEMVFLRRATVAFGLPESFFIRAMDRCLAVSGRSPYQILSVDKRIGYPALKRAYFHAVQHYHPDILTQAGMPPQVVALANRRLEQITQAYQAIKGRRKFAKHRL